MFTEVNDYFNAGYAYHKAAEYYEKDDAYEKAASTYQQSSLSDMKIKDTAGASTGFKKAAKSYEKAKNWRSAVDMYAASVEIDMVDRRYLDVADTYESMASCYYEMSDMKNSVYYHLKAADVRDKNNDKTNAALSYRDVGGIYQSEGSYDKAVEYYLKSAETYYSADNVAQAATSYSKAGDVYELRKDYESAADNYLKAAKTYHLSGDEKASGELYSRAAETCIKAGEGTKDNSKAAELNFKAALAYMEMGEHSKAAESYGRYAEFMDLAGDTEKAGDGFTRAAGEYVKAGMIWYAAEAYVNRGDYESACKLYEEHGKSREAEKDRYGAGIAYMELANCYRRLGRESIMKIGLTKALTHLTTFIDESSEKKELSNDDITLIGDAYRKMGECSQGLGDYNKAQLYMKKAEEYYLKTRDRGRLNIASGLRLKVEGIKAIDHGYYQKAEELMTEAQKLLNAAAGSGEWKREYARILREHSEEAGELVEKIKLKPEVDLDIDRRSYTFIDIPVILNMRLSNNGGYTMKDINFLQHLPEEIELMKLPEKIPELPPGTTRKSSVEVTPRKTGTYRIRPIEVYYEDQKGHRYVKASNEVNVDVVERPPTDYKSYMKAVDVFHIYAQSQEANGNWFQAGDGYRQMAEVYGSFNTDDTVRQYHGKAVEAYRRYVKENIAAVSADDASGKRLADAHWYMGESLRKTGELDAAAEAYGESILLYSRFNLEGLANRSKALKLKTEGIKAIETGEYERAEPLMNESLASFEEVIKSGGFDGRNIDDLERNESEVRSMLDTMKGKPGIEVAASCPVNAKVGDRIDFRVSIRNPLNFTLNKVKPVVKTVDGLELVEVPEVVDEVRAGETANIRFRVKVGRPGVYRFKPLDVAYIDNRGNTFMKGSNEVTLNAGGGDEKATPKAGAQTAAGGTPEVSLEFSGKVEAKAGLEAEAEGVLSNTGAVDVAGLRFIGNSTEGVEVTEVPGVVESLPAGMRMDVKIKLKAAAEGTFKLRPVEMFYRDLQGKRFFKGSGELTVKSAGGGN